jgi:hypothetical protein
MAPTLREIGSGHSLNEPPPLYDEEVRLLGRGGKSLQGAWGLNRTLRYVICAQRQNKVQTRFCLNHLTHQKV